MAQIEWRAVPIPGVFLHFGAKRDTIPFLRQINKYAVFMKFSAKFVGKPLPRRGFSLVELLVVVAIIVVLLALLFPSMKNTREQARIIQCKANLKTIGAASFVFAGEANGQLPATISQTNYKGSGEKENGWLGHEALPSGMKSPRVWYNEHPDGRGRGGYGMLYTYAGVKDVREILRCPSLKAGTRLGSGVGSNNMHDYSMISAFSGALVGSLPGYAEIRMPLSGDIEKVPAPLFLEEEPAYGLNAGHIDMDHPSINRLGTWHYGHRGNYATTEGGVHSLLYGASPGPQAWSWVVRMPNGEKKATGSLSGWRRWNR